MDKLPLETLQQIFQLACTDGGYTGCSLALTSKSIQVAARSTRFHSVALVAETERLDALITLFQKEMSVAGVRPRVAHLHLSLPRPVDMEDETNEEDEGEGEAEMPPPRFVLASRQFLDLIADDLQSLVISTYDPYMNYPLFDRVFPSLTDLTLLRLGQLGTLTTPDFKSNLDPLFPALTRLHIVDPNWAQPLFSDLTAHAPGVTHLRLSVHRLFGKLADELPDAVGTPAYPYKGGNHNVIVRRPPAQRTYPSLVRVVVQPGPPPPVGPCGTSRLAYNSKNVQLNWIAEQAQDTGVEMHVLSPCKWTARKWYKVIFREWVKKIGGEFGRDWFDEVDEDEDEDGSESEDEHN